jgi:hypothetical protein
MQLNKFILVMLLSTPALADSECTYVDETVIKTAGTIEQTRNYEYETAKYTDDKRVCAVKLDAKIGGKWIKTQDFYVFGPEMSQNEACSKAKDKAKVKALEEYVPQVITSNTNQHCREKIVNKEPDQVLEPGVTYKKIPKYKVVRENSIVCSALAILMPGPYINVRCQARKVPTIAGSEQVGVGTCRDYSRKETRSGQVWTIGGRECLQKDGTWFAIF